MIVWECVAGTKTKEQASSSPSLFLSPSRLTIVSNICVCSSSVFRDPVQVATGASLGGCAENHDDYDFLGSLLTPVCYWSMGKRGLDEQA
jgi:hypothetical protein